MINFTKEACGRGEEVKFQNYSEWNYNNYFEIVDRRWFDMKFLEKYASGMVPQNFSFALVSLHSLAFFLGMQGRPMAPSSQISDRQFFVSRPALSEEQRSFHNDN